MFATHMGLQKVKPKDGNLDRQDINELLCVGFDFPIVFQVLLKIMLRLKLRDKNNYKICLTRQRVIQNKFLIISWLVIAVEQFTDDPTVAICSDSGGSVFVLNFK